MIKGSRISNFLTALWELIKQYRTGVITTLILCFFYWLSTVPRVEPSAKGYSKTREGRIDSICVFNDTI